MLATRKYYIISQHKKRTIANNGIIPGSIAQLSTIIVHTSYDAGRSLFYIGVSDSQQLYKQLRSTHHTEQ